VVTANELGVWTKKKNLEKIVEKPKPKGGQALQKLQRVRKRTQTKLRRRPWKKNQKNEAVGGSCFDQKEWNLRPEKNLVSKEK